jgi:monofunctional biosynthetic peptidoglycan transglycosylase
MRRFRQVCLVLFSFLLIWQLWYVAWVLWWKFVNPSSTSFMAHQLDALQDKNPDAELKHDWVPYDKISIKLKRAVVASEDDGFVDHEGFDWEGIQNAIEKNRRKGKVVAGGSTISQQLAKNLFLSASKTPWRKGQEAIITVWLEAFWDKRRILEVYLNSVEWGEGVFGAEAAAKHYFNIPAAKLSAPQAARLAVMLPAPRKFQKNPYSAYLNHRTQVILGRMPSADIPR